MQIDPDDPIDLPPSYHGGELLLASPALRDPNFSRSVVYLTEHDSEGAHGIVLNLPIDSTASALLPHFAGTQLGDIPVFRGGPVGVDKLMFAKITWTQEDRSLLVETHLSPEAAADSIANGQDVRAFIGSAGWSAGQLDEELTESAWFVQSPDFGINDVDPSHELWRVLMTRRGPAYELMTLMPQRPELN